MSARSAGQVAHFAASLLASTAALALPVDALLVSGPSANRIDLVVLGDGFTSAEQGSLRAQAEAVVTGIFSVRPYKDYQGLFNVKLIRTASTESGADHPERGTTADTAFDAQYACGGIQRLVCVNASKVLQAAALEVPEFDVAMVIVNDSTYGGSGGSVPVVSVDPLAIEIIRHELGHTLGLLADEYEVAYPGYPRCSQSSDCAEPNATLRSDRALVKWSAWIPSSTPVPTPEGAGMGGVGAFEGCRYQTAGLYRPVESQCAMRALGEPFCPVCSEGLVRAFWNRVRPIDTVTPVGATLTLCSAGATFSVTQPTVSPDAWSHTWTLDGVPQGPTGATLTLPALAFSPGPHTVRVSVQDGTSQVRSDPNALLRDAHQWSVTYLDCGGYGCDGAGGCLDRCAQEGDCAQGHVCSGGACRAVSPDAGNAPEPGSEEGEATTGGEALPDEGESSAPEVRAQRGRAQGACAASDAGLGTLAVLWLLGLGRRRARPSST